MSYLEHATKPASKAPMLVVAGSPGVGKSSFAGTFDAPIFIQAEDASTVFENWDERVQPALLPQLPQPTNDCKTRLTLMDQMRELVSSEHPYKTVVVDTITELNTKFEKEICLRDNVDSPGSASGGFHKGFDTIAQWHAEFIYACDVLRKRKKMTIILLAHIGTRKVRNRPDGDSDYSVYDIEMSPKASGVYVANSDAVLYIKKEEFVTGAQQNKKGQTTKYGRLMQTGNRKIITTGDGIVGYVSAKNRYNMPAEIDLPMGENPITQYIKFYQQHNKAETTEGDK